MSAPPHVPALPVPDGLTGWSQHTRQGPGRGPAATTASDLPPSPRDCLLRRGEPAAGGQPRWFASADVGTVRRLLVGFGLVTTAGLVAEVMVMTAVGTPARLLVILLAAGAAGRWLAPARWRGYQLTPVLDVALVAAAGSILSLPVVLGYVFATVAINALDHRWPVALRRVGAVLIAYLGAVAYVAAAGHGYAISVTVAGAPVPAAHPAATAPSTAGIITNLVATAGVVVTALAVGILASALRARTNAEARTLAAQRQLVGALAAAPGGLIVIDAGEHVLLCSEDAARTLGRPIEEIRGRAITALIPGLNTGSSGAEVGHETPGQGWRMLRVTISAPTAPGAGQDIRVVTLADVTEERRRERDLRRRAETDPLTGLANRDVLIRRLDACIGTGTTGLALAIVDLDQFKAVNDARGHLTGDEVLVEIAGRLRLAAGARALCARLGGDEFAVLFEGITPGKAEAAARRLVDELAYALPAAGRQVTASVGVAVVPAGTHPSPTTALRRADEAMYQAKRAGGNRVTVLPLTGTSPSVPVPLS